MMDLDDYDRELLGTIMVRLCACSCVGRRQTPMNQSLVLMEEILKGAHIVVHGDRGAFYSYFTQMQVIETSTVQGWEEVGVGKVPPIPYLPPHPKPKLVTEMDPSFHPVVPRCGWADTGLISPDVIASLDCAHVRHPRRAGLADNADGEEP